jgi:elongation factor P--(R)-beta-lysine ligase
MKDLSLRQVIAARVELYRTIRSYFEESDLEESDVLEVEIPLLGHAGTTDPQINSFEVTGQNEARYLQSSPEFLLKRLLVEIRQSCFCITKAFRDEEHGRIHNPEFSMLEWYRVDFDLDAIIEDSLALIQKCLGRRESVCRETYRSLFQKHLNIDPHGVELEHLQLLVEQHTSYREQCLSTSEALQLLLSMVIEPKLKGLTVIRDFPLDQAALAKAGTDELGQEVAFRFEIYFEQMELANGYYELVDALEQRQRFEQDNQVRQKMGRSTLQIDESLLQAMERGLPDCSGVSIGLDRLLMAKLEQRNIDSVLLFPWPKV